MKNLRFKKTKSVKTTKTSEQIQKSEKSLETQYDDVINELRNEARYQADKPLATRFEDIAQKFGLEDYWPYDGDEAAQMIRRIETQLEETEQILKKYHSGDLGKTDNFESLIRNFDTEKEAAELYINWLRRFL